MTPAALATRIKATGRALGFDLVAIGPAAAPTHGPEFEAWLQRMGITGPDGRLRPQPPSHPLLAASRELAR